jgi:hypothetical protein
LFKVGFTDDNGGLVIALNDRTNGTGQLATSTQSDQMPTEKGQQEHRQMDEKEAKTKTGSSTGNGVIRIADWHHKWIPLASGLFGYLILTFILIN